MTRKDPERRPDRAGPLNGWRQALSLLIDETGLSDKDIERRVGLPGNQLNLVLRRNRMPRVEMLGKVLQGIGADAHDFADALDRVASRGARGLHGRVDAQEEEVRQLQRRLTELEELCRDRGALPGQGQTRTR